MTTDSSKFYSDGIVYFVANDNFMLGAPNIKYLRYKTITQGSEIDNLQNGEVHFSDPVGQSRGHQQALRHEHQLCARR